MVNFGLLLENKMPKKGQNGDAGADFVMDLSVGEGLTELRAAMVAACLSYAG